jgi:integrase
LDPRSLASGKRTLAETWEKLLEHHGASLRPSTRANWEQEWRAHIEPALGSWPVGKITTVAVKDFLAQLERKEVGSATRAKCRSILHRILEEAVENQEIPSNPAAARGTRVKQPHPKKARVLSPDEVSAVLSTARMVASATDALAMEAMFFLGLRIGEMAALQAGDVDLGRREITVQRTVVETGGHLTIQNETKTGKSRVLRMPLELPLWGRLVEHIKSHGLIKQAPLFAAIGGGPIRPNNWRRRVWGRVMVEACIQDPPTPHSGRRTTASLLSEAGVPPATVQAILGHSTLAQTGEYIDVRGTEMESALKKLAAHHPAS